MKDETSDRINYIVEHATKSKLLSCASVLSEEALRIAFHHHFKQMGFSDFLKNLKIVNP